jgi:excisionase family DNA binding protein
MAYPAYIRERARELRIEKKLTIDELADRLAVSRTTIYYWVRDLPIGQTEKQTLAAYRAGQVTRRIACTSARVTSEAGTSFQFAIPILLGAVWIDRLASNPIVFSFQHHADQDPDELCAFWGNLLSIDPSTIKFQRKSIPICEPVSRLGWIASAPSGPKIVASGRSSAW